MTHLSPETKLGPLGEAFISARVRAQARRLRELEAGKATAVHDPLAALERREAARQERHMGSVVRRLHRQGKIGERHLDALEEWALDHSIAQAGVRSNLGKEPSGGDRSGGDASDARWKAEGRFLVARAALYVAVGPDAGRITEAVACANMSLSAATARVLGKSAGRAVGDALEMLKAGAESLGRHYAGRGGR